MKTKKKLAEETARRYCKAGKKQKTKMIDEFTATTGYNRKYAIHILKNAAKIKITHYNNVERKSVQIIEYFAVKFDYPAELKTKLSKISSATIGRMIKPEIQKYSIRGISTTRPAKNLNKLIPIRVYFDWNSLEPGFFEADTVANCGMSAEGQYISTLTLTDVYSGWTATTVASSRTRSCSAGAKPITFSSRGAVRTRKTTTASKYDEAKTPYTRLMECKALPEEYKQELKRRKNSLDLELLLQKTQELQAKLISLAVPWSK